MQKYVISSMLLGALIFFIKCTIVPDINTDLEQAAIIPRPITMESYGKAFLIKDISGIKLDEDSKEWTKTIVSLQSFADNEWNKDLEIGDNGNIIIQNNEATEEGYSLEISKDKIVVGAGSDAGAFYAVQTLRQMVVSSEEGGPYLPTGRITDAPEYTYRGMMLDVARHFFTVDEVKELIDHLSFYKINHLHLHLTDDQGWRIEIKSRPELTEIGGQTEVGGGEGGFYTQEQYRDLVAYASERNIIIIPEVDMPGHTNAALAAYPELNCDGKARELYTGIEVGFSTFCVRSEATYEFIDDVVREIVALTPGPYFHIGGDESHVTEKNDYIYFINRVFGIVKNYNKTPIGWDEITTADFGDEMIAQYWADPENAQAAIDKGGKLLISPAKYAYLDMQYDSTSQYGLHWAAYIEVDEGYNWDPDTLVVNATRDHIIGIEAPLWSETVSNMNEAEYLIYPRLLGYAEIGWTPDSLRNWNDYQNRLVQHGKLMESKDIAFYRSGKVNWE